MFDWGNTTQSSLKIYCHAYTTFKSWIHRSWSITPFQSHPTSHIPWPTLGAPGCRWTHCRSWRGMKGGKLDIRSKGTMRPKSLRIMSRYLSVRPLEMESWKRRRSFVGVRSFPNTICCLDRGPSFFLASLGGVEYFTGTHVLNSQTHFG